MAREVQPTKTGRVLVKGCDDAGAVSVILYYDHSYDYPELLAKLTVKNAEGTVVGARQFLYERVSYLLSILNSTLLQATLDEKMHFLLCYSFQDRYCKREVEKAVGFEYVMLSISVSSWLEPNKLVVPEPDCYDHYVLKKVGDVVPSLSSTYSYMMLIFNAWKAVRTAFPNDRTYIERNTLNISGPVRVGILPNGLDTTTFIPMYEITSS